MRTLRGYLGTSPPPEQRVLSTVPFVFRIIYRTHTIQDSMPVCLQGGLLCTVICAVAPTLVKVHQTDHRLTCR
jgi:hypothetical protein